MCFTKLNFLLKLRPHTSHWKGFSPVCERMCLFRLHFCENDAEHTVQAYGFCPRWMRM